MAAKFSMSGRADYGDATTVALIEELADLMKKAAKLDEAIYSRLPVEKRSEYEDITCSDYNEEKLRKYATEWQTSLDGAV